MEVPAARDRDGLQAKGWLRLRRQGEGIQDQFVTTNLDTLATALYVRTDDLLKESPQLAPCRPEIGIGPKLSDAELVTLAVMQALLRFTSEARWLRHARVHLRHLFPCLPQQPGYNKRLRRAGSLIRDCIRVLAADATVWTDDVWVVDSTPVECGRSRETARRSDLAGWAEYGYCASHSRYFRGLRLHLVCTLQGLPAAFALAGAKADEREVLAGMLAAGPDLLAARPGQSLIGDKNYYGRDFEAAIAAAGITLLRPARKGEAARAGAPLFKPLRQIIESINDTFKASLTWNATAATPRRRDGPRPAAHPRPDRRDLAQRHHRPARPALARGLRPLTLELIIQGSGTALT
jgi:hypothetical protein